MVVHHPDGTYDWSPMGSTGHALIAQVILEEDEVPQMVDALINIDLPPQEQEDLPNQEQEDLPPKEDEGLPKVDLLDIKMWKE